MKLIPVGRGMSAMVDDEDFDWLSRFNWCCHKPHRTWYAGTTIDGVFRHMNNVILNIPDGFVSDHKDGDGLNNQRSNLRQCTDLQNSRNRRKNRNNKSGFKGVCWHKASNRWTAQIKVNFRTIYLGVFKDAKTAALEYDKAATKHFGEFAMTNENLGLFNSGQSA